ncbi:YceI family protein [Aquimarina sp. AU58]|uniref:YceI family protein n=1 Tax=Aquimarina sp. AU58 TaxID=1874112 RepID=UPI000D643E65|nr:YceI family protein [Aquimarina sp. AU58]
MKIFIIIFCFLISGISRSQEKYIEKKGTIAFEASEKTFEPVKAKNTSVTAILNINTGEIASLALMKEFRFRNALMEEHFNENYIESDIYSKAIFRGKIIAFNFFELSDQEKEFNVNGQLKLHGREKSIESILYLSKKDKYISLRGEFVVTPQGFDISIPKIVRNKIAEHVKVFVDFKLKQQ